MAPTPKLKIGLVVDDTLDKPDGVQQYVLSIGEWLTGQGHEVHYLAGETSRTDLPNIHSLSRNIHVRFNGNRLSIPMPTSRKRLRTLLETEKFDVLHVQMPHSPWLAHRLVLAAPVQAAIIATFHIVAYSKFVELATKVLALWTRKSVRRFDKILSVSSAAVAYAKATYGITTTISPNVIDYARFQSAEPFPEYSGTTPTILFLGRLVPRKGCKVLLEAAAELVAQGDIPSFKVLVCGKGPLKEELEAFAAANNIGDIVTFTGFVEEADKPRFYASADISVFPSSGGESFGIVLLEAMASGKAAVLGGDNSGYRSVLEPDPYLLFAPQDASALAQKLKELLTNETLRQEKASWGTEYTRNFDVNVVGQQLTEIYAQALRKRQPE
jgi:phosphatidylinositol alpha-mannosyltransferase